MGPDVGWKRHRFDTRPKTDTNLGGSRAPGQSGYRGERAVHRLQTFVLIDDLLRRFEWFPFKENAQCDGRSEERIISELARSLSRREP